MTTPNNDITFDVPAQGGGRRSITVQPAGGDAPPATGTRAFAFRNSTPNDASVEIDITTGEITIAAVTVGWAGGLISGSYKVPDVGDGFPGMVVIVAPDDSGYSLVFKNAAVSDPTLVCSIGFDNNSYGQPAFLISGPGQNTIWKADGSIQWSTAAHNFFWRTDGLIEIDGAILTVCLVAVSASIGGGALLAGATASTTVSVPGATTAMGVVVTPVTYPGDGFTWQGHVSSAGVVTVKVTAIVAGTPTATAYNVRVIR